MYFLIHLCRLGPSVVSSRLVPRSGKLMNTSPCLAPSIFNVTPTPSHGSDNDKHLRGKIRTRCQCCRRQRQEYLEFSNVHEEKLHHGHVNSPIIPEVNGDIAVLEV